MTGGAYIHRMDTTPPAPHPKALVVAGAALGLIVLMVVLWAMFSGYFAG